MGKIKTILKYPKCPETFKDCLPSEAAAQAEIVMNRLTVNDVYYCKFCGAYHFTSKEKSGGLSLYKQMRRMVVEGDATYIKDVSLLAVEYKAKIGNFTYTFTYNPTNEHITVTDKD